VEENENLVKEEETKNEGGILVMANIVWYPNIGASNHIWGHKHLFLYGSINISFLIYKR